MYNEKIINNLSNKKMQQKMKAILFLLVAVIGLTAVQAKAATNNWKDYFTLDEGKALRKMVDKYVRQQLEEGEDNWEGIIGKDSVDKSIAKKKVFKGSITCEESFADKTTVDDDGSPGDPLDDTTHYYKKVSFDGIDLDNPPVIQLYTKLATDTERAELDSSVWEIDTPYVSDGKAWIEFGYKNDDGGGVINCDITQYKLVINY
jgi:hypothetical protein